MEPVTPVKSEQRGRQKEHMIVVMPDWAYEKIRRQDQRRHEFETVSRGRIETRPPAEHAKGQRKGNSHSDTEIVTKHHLNLAPAAEVRSASKLTLIRAIS